MMTKKLHQILTNAISDEEEGRKIIDDLLAGFDPVSERRERIATAVLAGMMANPDHPEQSYVRDACAAIEQADALIAELDRQEDTYHDQ